MTRCAVKVARRTGPDRAGLAGDLDRTLEWSRAIAPATTGTRISRPFVRITEARWVKVKLDREVQ
jgi:hypothetical protein